MLQPPHLRPNHGSVFPASCLQACCWPYALLAPPPPPCFHLPGGPGPRWSATACPGMGAAAGGACHPSRWGARCSSAHIIPILQVCVLLLQGSLASRSWQHPVACTDTQHLINLATIAAAAGGLLVPVQARICAGSDMLTIRISDQGGGIPAEDMAQVGGLGGGGSREDVPATFRAADGRGQSCCADEVPANSSQQYQALSWRNALAFATSHSRQSTARAPQAIACKQLLGTKSSMHALRFSVQVFSYGFTTIPGGTPGLGDGGTQSGAGGGTRGAAGGAPGWSAPLALLGLCRKASCSMVWTLAEGPVYVFIQPDAQQAPCWCDSSPACVCPDR